MEKIIFRVIIFTSACCLSKKHVHVLKDLKWADARAHCRNYYTDLSPLTNELEEEVFRESEEKTWEEALKYCTRNQDSLSSLLSETENLLATKEIQQTSITERVWIGLRYLEDEWLWVNGDPLVYKNWTQGEEDLQCPLKRRCGALTKEGEWENWDCQEKLHFICG
ncbi:macrophage mannose receptor 1-like [Nematolebias whitei]|uniref:macrophage mannose receptor 1-like n=1 Tax=Nematolebias whitei TaxID=451745 RepID=UPI00189ADD16|nr:macrophage mannose receptor 1-like [Nematolebias whitei]